jgi:hypothetical protein
MIPRLSGRKQKHSVEYTRRFVNGLTSFEAARISTLSRYRAHASRALAPDGLRLNNRVGGSRRATGPSPLELVVIRLTERSTRPCRDRRVEVAHQRVHLEIDASMSRSTDPSGTSTHSSRDRRVDVEIDRSKWHINAFISRSTLRSQD